MQYIHFNSTEELLLKIEVVKTIQKLRQDFVEKRIGDMGCSPYLRKEDSAIIEMFDGVVEAVESVIFKK